MGAVFTPPALAGVNVFAAGHSRSSITPVVDLEVGSIVKMNLSGVPCEWIVVNQGIPKITSHPVADAYHSSCDGTWLLLKDIFELREWGGNRSWVQSSVKSYLNSDFFAKFDQEVQDVIKLAKIPYYNNGSLQYGENISGCKIFLLSCNEIGYGYTGSTNYFLNGDTLSFFFSGDDGVARNQRIANWDSLPWEWLLRDAISSQAGRPFICTNEGYITTTLSRYSYEPSGVRPALILPFETLADAAGNVIV